MVLPGSVPQPPVPHKWFTPIDVKICRGGLALVDGGDLPSLRGKNSLAMSFSESSSQASQSLAHAQHIAGTKLVVELKVGGLH